MSKRPPPWNKGLTKDKDERLRVHADRVRQTLKGRESSISIEGRRTLSEVAKKRGLGGYRPHPNRGMYYNGVWFDSSWEVKVAQSLDENGVLWERPRTGFIWNDKGNRYFPDFFLPDYHVYLDPKNDYLIRKDKEKIEEAQKRNGIKVLVLNGNQCSWSAIHALVVQ